MHARLARVNLVESRSSFLEHPAPCQGAGKVGDVSPPGVRAPGFSWGTVDVFVPPSSGCPQGCTVLPSSGDMQLPGSTVTLLLMFLGFSLPWDCALLQPGFMAHSLVVNYSRTKFLGGQKVKFW